MIVSNLNLVCGLYYGSKEAIRAYYGTLLIFEKMKVGETFEFSYTGTVLQITLPSGRYKLLCWGAQGGGVGTSFPGGKGGYSEGILKLTKTTTLYIFVGGKGTDLDQGKGSTPLHGGWNGGGGSKTVTSQTDSDGDRIVSYPRPGGGATDIALVSSSMGYSTSSYCTIRDTGSLKSRIIVAGGGGGGTRGILYSNYTFFYEGGSNAYGGGIKGGGDGGTLTYSGSSSSFTGDFGNGSSLLGSSGGSSGAGGGGWYGGGSWSASTNAFSGAGGGSGFVNTPTYSLYLPEGYSGLTLESGFTIGGNLLFESVEGTTEAGHAGNGYARITILNPNGKEVCGPIITWSILSGTWNKVDNINSVEGAAYGCSKPKEEEESIKLRCTFSGLTNITFSCLHNSSYVSDYLTIGKLDTECTRTNYSTSLRNESNSRKSLTFTPTTTGEHYIEFCYSIGGYSASSSNSALIYVESYGYK